MGTSDRPALIKWILVIVATIGLGVFIFTSQWVPDRYRLWLAILDYALFTYANYMVISIKKKSRQKTIQDGENRAARRQMERLKNK